MSGPDRYAVFGNPVRHSLSPRIHAEFARQCRQRLQYRAVRVERGKFGEAARRFFAGGGRGLNVTLPFKRDAFEFADEHSDRAHRAGAVNTLRAGETDGFWGDNTDGVGLVRDMIANLGWTVAGRRVMILGAGGAVRGVLEPLLRERPEELVLVNRTGERAAGLAREFGAVGPVSGGGYELLDDGCFDILINGTSAGLSGELPPLAGSVLSERSCCYDMMYGPEPTAFMRWAAQHTAWAVADGLGMLVEQAAESFFVWRGERPRTAPVIAALHADMAGRDR